MYIQLIGRIEALPKFEAEIGPVIFSSENVRGSEGRESDNSSTTPIGPTPGPPPPCGIQKVL